MGGRVSCAIFIFMLFLGGIECLGRLPPGDVFSAYVDDMKGLTQAISENRKFIKIGVTPVIYNDTTTLMFVQPKFKQPPDLPLNRAFMYIQSFNKVNVLQVHFESVMEANATLQFFNTTLQEYKPNFDLWLHTNILHGPGQFVQSDAFYTIFDSLCPSAGGREDEISLYYKCARANNILKEFRDVAKSRIVVADQLNRFVNEWKTFGLNNTFTLSLGWETGKWEKGSSYSWNNVLDMIEALRIMYNGTAVRNINFRVRASFLSRSLNQLAFLLSQRMYKSSLTIFNERSDEVQLQWGERISTLFPKKVYFDLKEVHKFIPDNETYATQVRNMRKFIRKYAGKIPIPELAYHQIINITGFIASNTGMYIPNADGTIEISATQDCEIIVEKIPDIRAHNNTVTNEDDQQVRPLGWTAKKNSTIPEHEEIQTVNYLYFSRSANQKLRLTLRGGGPVMISVDFNQALTMWKHSNLIDNEIFYH